MFIEGGYQKKDITSVGSCTKDCFQVPFGFGGDVKTGEKTWLSLYFSVDLASGAVTSLANFKFAVGDKRPL